jgi:hypothetical protein
LINLNDIWYGGDAIQGDPYAIIFNPISSTILKWLRFEVVSLRHDFKPCTAMFCYCLIVGLLWFYNIQSLANVTVTTTACNILQGKIDIKAAMLQWQTEIIVYCRAKTS